MMYDRDTCSRDPKLCSLGIGQLVPRNTSLPDTIGIILLAGRPQVCHILRAVGTDGVLRHVGVVEVLESDQQAGLLEDGLLLVDYRLHSVGDRGVIGYVGPSAGEDQHDQVGVEDREAE